MLQLPYDTTPMQHPDGEITTPATPPPRVKQAPIVGIDYPVCIINVCMKYQILWKIPVMYARLVPMRIKQVPPHVNPVHMEHTKTNLGKHAAIPSQEGLSPPTTVLGTKNVPLVHLQTVSDKPWLAYINIRM